MPRATEAGPSRGWVEFVPLGAMLALCAVGGWLHVAIVAVFASLVGAAALSRRRHVRAMAVARRADSICGFARSFDRRAVDTWIIRAVHERVSGACGFPIRAEDRLEVDLGIDDQDLYHLVQELARCAGRVVDDSAVHSDAIATVRDLVLSLNARPRVLA